MHAVDIKDDDERYAQYQYRIFSGERSIEVPAAKVVIVPTSLFSFQPGSKNARASGQNSPRSSGIQHILLCLGRIPTLTLADEKSEYNIMAVVACIIHG